MNGNNQSQTCPTCQNTSNSFIAGAAIGAVLGTVLGLLFAPASGEESRKNVVRAATNTKRFVEEKVDDVQDFYEDVKEDTTDFIHQVEKKAAPIKRQASRYASDALDTIEDSARDAKKKFFKGVKI